MMTPHQNMNRLADWVAETSESIAARLEGAKASQGQTRWTLGVMAFISIMMLITSYNAYLSYDYHWILQEAPDSLADEKKETPDSGVVEKKEAADPKAAENEKNAQLHAARKRVTTILTEQALKDWASARIVMIPLLGIRVSVDDAPVLGTAVLFVLSLWLLLVTRRENHTVGFLLRDTDSSRPDDNQGLSVKRSMENQPAMYTSGERWLIFHTIISNNIFVTFDPSLSSVHSLEGPNPLTARATGRFKGWLNRVGFGLISSFFFLFPVVASLTVFGIDRRSYRIPDPFEVGFKNPGFDDPFFRPSLIVFFVCWIPLAVCSLRSIKYSRDTEKVLREYGRKLRADLLQGNDALDKLNHEQKESSTQPVTTDSKSTYIIALLFASIFIASTTILFVGVSRIFNSTSDPSIWVIVTAIVSALGTISTTMLGWRKDKREVREQELKITQLKQELAATREKPALPVPQENRE